jgi:hypothetical protein
MILTCEVWQTALAVANISSVYRNAWRNGFPFDNAAWKIN